MKPLTNPSFFSRSYSSCPFQVLTKKAKFLIFKKELPLGAFFEQEIQAFFAPGFPLPSGLIVKNSK
jgi:hypothetical protein